MLYLRAQIRAVCVRSNTLSPVEQNVFSHANIIGGFALTYSDAQSVTRIIQQQSTKAIILGWMY